MKVAITSQGDSLDSSFDTRFGRAKNFIIYDLEEKTYDLMPNTQNLNAVQGAGIQAAQNVCSSGAKMVLTGHCGPKAFKALSVAGIKVYNLTAQTVKEAIEVFEKGDLKEALQADVQGHWI